MSDLVFRSLAKNTLKAFNWTPVMNLQIFRGRWKADVRQQSWINTFPFAINLVVRTGTQTPADVRICKQNIYVSKENKINQTRLDIN